MSPTAPPCLSVVRGPPGAPRQDDEYASSEWPRPLPRLRSTVESVRSRCQRDTGSLAAMWPSSALATPRLPSLFSKSMGLTCGRRAGRVG